ncbi:MAG: hypothetical protein ABI970_08725 [Chloroflexota bacterium]|nr:hypothetical protein [Anaerolineae bacterium]
MIDPFVQALHDWQTFYFMMGTASATLIGLMFIAVSLGADLPAATDESGISAFVTPMLIHFGSVLMISALMLIPTFRLMSLGIAVVVIGGAFTIYSFWIRRQFINHPSNGNYSKSDWKWYVYFPIIGDVMVIVTGIWLLSGSTDSLNLLAVALVVLLIISVRNTWDLMMWIAQYRQKAKPND